MLGNKRNVFQLVCQSDQTCHSLGSFLGPILNNSHVPVALRVVTHTFCIVQQDLAADASVRKWSLTSFASWQSCNTVQAPFQTLHAICHANLAGSTTIMTSLAALSLARRSCLTFHTAANSTRCLGEIHNVAGFASTHRALNMYMSHAPLSVSSCSPSLFS